MKKTAKKTRLTDLSRETHAVKGGGVGVPQSPRRESAVNQQPGAAPRPLLPCI